MEKVHVRASLASRLLYLASSRTPAFQRDQQEVRQRYTITAPQRVPSGKATIRYEFAYDGGDPGSGGTGTIFVNGEKVAEGRIDKTTPFVFSADETADVGIDEATPVTEEYAERHNEFNGQIDKVTVELN